MAYGSGLSAQFGFAAEGTVGTIATPDHFVEVDDGAGMKWEPEYKAGRGLHAGSFGVRTARTGLVRRGATGQVTVPFTKNTMGLLLKHCLGATTGPTLIGVTTAYSQIHAPGDLAGLSLTTQFGKPLADGTVKPFTYRGCKVKSWELKIAEGEDVTLTLDFDGWDEDTASALAAASYVDSSVFDGTNVSVLTIGGTATTESGEASVGGSATAVASVAKSISIKGENAIADSRRGVGSDVKKEQIRNGDPTYTVSLDMEWGNEAEMYDLFRAGTISPFHVRLTGDAIDTQVETLDIIVPALHFTSGGPELSGLDILPNQMEGTARNDASNALIQVKLISTDTTL